MTTTQSPAMVEVDRLPELPPFSQLVSHMLRDYVPSTIELQVAAAIRKYAKDYATEAIAAKRAEVERLSAECEKLIRLLQRTSACINSGSASEYAKSASRDAEKYLAALATTTQGEPR